MEMMRIGGLGVAGGGVNYGKKYGYGDVLYTAVILMIKDFTRPFSTEADSITASNAKQAL